MYLTGLVVITVALLVDNGISQTGPNQCTYSEGGYTCDYTQMVSSDRPIDFYEFSVQPQLLLLQVNGLVPYFGDSRLVTTGFSTAVGMDISIFDENNPATFIIDCGYQGSTYISTGAFYFMEYVEKMTIRNCITTYIGTDTFSAFVELDYLSLEGGSLDDMELTAMSGLSVKKLTTSTHNFPRRHGRVAVINTQLAYGLVTPGLLDYFTNISSIILQNNGISYITRDQFQNNLLVKTIDLSDNIFPELPSEVFKNLNGLSLRDLNPNIYYGPNVLAFKDLIQAEITLYNVPWTCTCGNLQWFKDVLSNHITVRGDMMCDNINGMSVRKYYYETCVASDVCHGTTGISYGSKCITVLGLTAICLGCIGFIIACVAMVITIINIRDLQNNEPDPVLLERLKRRAKQRWIKAARTIIYAKRTGRLLAGVFESKSSIKTMSIPDETRTRYGGDNSRNTNDSSIPDFHSFYGSQYHSSPGNSGSPDSYGRMHRVHSMSDASYADFPADDDNMYYYNR